MRRSFLFTAAVIALSLLFLKGSSAIGKTAVDSVIPPSMIFELLAGQPPFTGVDTLAVVAQRFDPRVPSVRDHCPEIPQPLVVRPAVDSAVVSPGLVQ